MQRLRLRFSRGARLKYISHLDLIRLWHRAFRRAGLELAYSEGFNPHPRIHIAAPLPLGVTGESELMDVVFAREYSPHYILTMVNQQLPDDLEVKQVMVAALNAPSLQGQVRRAHYRVEVSVGNSRQEVEAAIANLLDLDNLPWTHRREEKTRSYDLRSQIYDIWIEEATPSIIIIGMDLQCDSGGSGRPEQVVKALGLPPPVSIHRTKLVIEAN
ncbi:MAG: TIGR03936 family radical SAM-associated protein [Dehalococcoidales bacterium]|jgi:radical SAM-linked protein|nr:TIGR03936 family radical SAM-associated protein [Dehalococcoidales bacterium]